MAASAKPTIQFCTFETYTRKIEPWIRMTADPVYVPLLHRQIQVQLSRPGKTALQRCSRCEGSLIDAFNLYMFRLRSCSVCLRKVLFKCGDTRRREKFI